MTSTLEGMVRVGASYFQFPTLTASEWYAEQLRKEDRMNDFDRHLDAQADAAREAAESYVRRFNEGATVHNPEGFYAEVDNDGPDDFAIDVWSADDEHHREQNFTGADPLATFIAWVEGRESLDVAA